MKTIITSLVVLAILAISLLFIRGSDWLSCTVAASDLGRKTEFSWVSGKCMVFRANGEKVYLNQIRDSSDSSGE
ncbi:hypothetical protein APT65_00114 [Trabzonvirus APT65]|uniref:Uncharacterized protein n=1 Tax=Aeromonas phage APT65 TaxID=2982914 RepID=A0A9E8GEG6_9CAUD|nr:hypothetical protein APT65_00114 [Aeromonas phage APT65]